MVSSEHRHSIHAVLKVPQMKVQRDQVRLLWKRRREDKDKAYLDTDDKAFLKVVNHASQQ